MANCCVIFSTTVVCLAAILVGLYYKQVIPEGLPDDQHFSARLFGVGWDIFSFIGYTASLVGIGDSHPENLNRLLHLPLALVPPESKDEFEIKDIEIANVPVRIYKPKHLSTDADKKLTGVVYLHGGGWMLGSVELYHPLLSRFAKETKVVWISVNYRLAPKHIFPEQFQDCYDVIKTLLATGGQYGIDINRIVVAGDSAGGNLATAVALKLRDENNRLMAAQILIYPALQFMDLSTPSFLKMSAPPATRHQVAVYWSYYMTGTPDMASSFLVNNHSVHLHNTKYSSYIRVEDKEMHKTQRKPLDGIPKAVLDGLTDYRASPLMADNLKGLPKTLLITCEYDVVKDDGLLYKARLQGAGVKVTHFNYMAYHGFLSLQQPSSILAATEVFLQAFQDIVDYIKELSNSTDGI